MDSHSTTLDRKQFAIFDVKLNEHIKVKGYSNQQKPDILIVHKKTKAKFFIGELKKSFSKSSLKNVYKKQTDKWYAFPKAKFLFVIFCVNLSKVKTYKKMTTAALFVRD